METHNIQGHVQATTGKQIKCGVTGSHLNIQLCCDEGKFNACQTEADSSSMNTHTRAPLLLFQWSLDSNVSSFLSFKTKTCINKLLV